MGSILEQLAVPIVLAPLAGGPSTPSLTAAVSNAGGLGFLASGYLAATALEEQIAETRALTDRPFGVNVFVPSPEPADPATYAPYLERLAGEAARLGVVLGEPRFDDDQWDAKISLLTRDPVAVVSFTFGCPSPDVVERLHRAGSEVWITVTTPAEALEAAGQGADVLVAQGIEAGGHRACFVDAPGSPGYGLLALLQSIGMVVDRPLVATGGIATAAGVAAALAAGARAAQVGTALMLAPEAGTSDVHRQAIASERETTLTRAFTGRLARGIRNRFTEELSGEAPLAYPEIHHATAPLRAAGRKSGDREVVNLWAGQAHALARAQPAAEIVAALAPDGG